MTKRKMLNTMYHHILDQVPSSTSSRWIVKDTYKDFRRAGFQVRTAILLTDTMIHDMLNHGLAYGKYKSLTQ